MSFWESNNDFWNLDLSNFNLLKLFLLIFVLTTIFLFSNLIRRKVGFIRRSLLPTAVIAGIIALILKTIGVFDSFFNVEASNKILEAITYHTLALGFIALTLKSTEKEKNKTRSKEIFDAGLITVNTYAIQAIIGIFITITLASTFMKDLLPASGLLLPLGFGQGSGQAMNFGGNFEEYNGFTGGLSFGLTIAAVGFLVACLIGVLHIYIMKKKGIIKEKDTNTQFVTTEVIASPNEVPVTESVDRLTIQIALIFLVYFITFIFMLFVEKLPLGNFGAKTLSPLVWGFNFLIGSLFAVLVKQLFKIARKWNLNTRDYPNNYLLNRISGFMFDIMIFAGIAAIKIEVLKGLLIPLILLCLFGTIVTYYYLRYVCNKKFPNYSQEAFVSLFGMLTGTASTGMILLREVDPKFETPAASNLVFQSFYAIALGFPLFLLLGFAPEGMNESIISLAVVILMFLIFNFILFRKFSIRKKGITNK